MFLYATQQYGDTEGRWMNQAEMELKLELPRNTILLVEIVKELKGQVCNKNCIFCELKFFFLHKVKTCLSFNQ